jgi:hypothetical protein
MTDTLFKFQNNQYVHEFPNGRKRIIRWEANKCGPGTHILAFTLDNKGIESTAHQTYKDEAAAFKQESKYIRAMY